MKMWILLFLSLKAYSGTRVFEGSASFEGQTVFIERHTQVWDNDVLISEYIEFLEPEGKKIGFQKSDFTRSFILPEFIFHDQRTHHLQALQRRGETLFAHSQEGRKRPLVQRLLLPEERIVVAGPGLIQFITRNLDEIISQKTVRFSYLIPGKLQLYDFIIRTKHHDPLKAEFEIRLDSWWLRYFTPRIRLIFDVPHRRLLSFEGLTGIRDADGDMMSVDIDYDYNL